MCSRYHLRARPGDLKQAFDVHRFAFEQFKDIEYFPGSTVPILRAAADGQREIIGLDWGIRLGRHRVTNSRDDKIERTWKRFMHRRVVFPLSRAVEWRYPLDMFGQPTGKPRPWVLYPADESVAAVAGIAAPDDQGVSMMTCQATGLAAEVHNKNPDDPRMVVFLTEQADITRWLDHDVTPADAATLLKPPPEGWLAAEALTSNRRVG
jgi:putative SOS response-associated peptidase YedK